MLCVPACPSLPLRSWSLVSPGPEGQRGGAQAHESGRAEVLRCSVSLSLLERCSWRGHEMVKAQQPRAFPDRLCLILPPALTDPRPNLSFISPDPLHRVITSLTA